MGAYCLTQSFLWRVSLELKFSIAFRGGARHFHLGGPLEGPVLQQGELSMVCVGLQCSDMTSPGKFWESHWGGQAKFGGGRQNLGGSDPLARP